MKIQSSEGLRKGIVIGLVIIIVAVPCFTVYFNSKLDMIQRNVPQPAKPIASVGGSDYLTPVQAAKLPPPSDKYNKYGLQNDPNVENIMLLGSDSLTPNPLDGRSDSAILISINKKTHNIYMSSFMRDMFVPIPGYENNRINAAFAYGGPDLYLGTVNQDFRIAVDKYVVVGFGGFQKVIDDIGGVDINLTPAETRQVNLKSGSDLSPGVQHLNGKEALNYARIRKIDSDFVRTERQRTVMMQVLDKFKMLGPIQMDQTLNDLLPNLSTNMSNSELMSLLSGSIIYSKYPVTQLQIPANGSWGRLSADGMDVLQVDFEANIELLQKTIYGNISEAGETPPDSPPGGS